MRNNDAENKGAVPECVLLWLRRVGKSLGNPGLLKLVRFFEEQKGKTNPPKACSTVKLTLCEQRKMTKAGKARGMVLFLFSNDGNGKVYQICLMPEELKELLHNGNPVFVPFSFPHELDPVEIPSTSAASPHPASMALPTLAIA